MPSFSSIFRLVSLLPFSISPLSCFLFFPLPFSVLVLVLSWSLSCFILVRCLGLGLLSWFSVLVLVCLGLLSWSIVLVFCFRSRSLSLSWSCLVPCVALCCAVLSCLSCLVLPCLVLCGFVLSCVFRAWLF